MTALITGLSIDVGSAATRSYSVDERTAVTYSGAWHVESGGDVNGDGTPDSLFSKARQVGNLGRVYVVFGNAMTGHVDLDNLGDDGFVIDGAEDHGWPDVSGVGDVNGDGLGDILVGAPEANRAYLVFGKTSSTPVNLVTFDAYGSVKEGFRIDGISKQAVTGEQVAPAGDVNQDGLADMLVAAPFARSIYVVFGKTDFLPIDLSQFHSGTQGDAGYLIRSPAINDDEFYSLSFAGDVNGDGRPDAALAVLRISEPRKRGAWIVFGKDDPERVNVLKGLDGRGIWIRGYIHAVGGVGDVNGDGFADVLVHGGRDSFVIFGRRRAGIIRTKYLGERGFVIRPEHTMSYGHTIAALGDVNGDGLGDILLGNPDEDRGGKNAGAAFVIFGKKGTRTVQTRDLGRGGYRIDGCAGCRLGSTVASPGDFDADGVAEILLGAWGAFRERSEQGGAYLVRGHQ